MTSQSKWKRWTQQGSSHAGGTNHFPKSKYNFSEHLESVGDWVKTSPLDAKDIKRFQDAAYSWAWQRGWKVHTKTIKASPNTWECICMLKSKKLIREFD